ncbi:hypothetical protein SynA1560_03087 [Synechococcus sp. A15-60]|nr:hypothetical protein SynA1560_03087 [Synechococcus sp. A15-60]
MTETEDKVGQEYSLNCAPGRTPAWSSGHGRCRIGSPRMAARVCTAMGDVGTPIVRTLTSAMET